mmetsp:Transcript_65017/g.76352  ORF Transcript_65017/g.76352 Transcript_65017/m.76352 type:complete len:145 (+) Transcript_65017:131-565(+)
MSMIVFEVRKRGSAMKQYPTTIINNLSNVRNVLPTQMTSDRVAQQAALYVCALLAAYSPAVISALLDTMCMGRNCKIPVVQMNILIAVFQPLQGFFNFIIYVRPQFNLVRSQNNDMSVLSVLKVVTCERNLNKNKRRISVQHFP